MQIKLSECCGCAYSLIIVDLNMPRMGGIEFMNTIEEKISKGELLHYKNSTFVLSTAQGDSH
jgi:CheY-like chemotaxis protein